MAVRALATVFVFPRPPAQKPLFSTRVPEQKTFCSLTLTLTPRSRGAEKLKLNAKNTQNIQPLATHHSQPLTPNARLLAAHSLPRTKV